MPRSLFPLSLSFGPDTGATAPTGGAAPAPSTTAATTPAPGASAAAAPDIAKVLASIQESQSALAAKLEALEGAKSKAEAEKQKAEADKGAAEQKALTVEQQLAAQKDELAKIQAQAAADKVDAAVARVTQAVQFASPVHGELAVKAFKADHKLEVKDGAVLAIGPDGKPQHLANAFGAWAKSPAGGIFVASPTQPGAGAPPGSTPEGSAQRKPFKDMTDEEFAAVRASGAIKGTLTNDRDAPVLQVKTVHNPYLKRRAELLGMARGNAAPQQNGTR